MKILFNNLDELSYWFLLSIIKEDIFSVVSSICQMYNTVISFISFEEMVELHFSLPITNQRGLEKEQNLGNV